MTDGQYLNPNVPVRPPAPEPLAAETKKPFSAKGLRIVLLAVFGLLVLVFIVAGTFGRTVISKQSQDLVGLKIQSKIANDQLANLTKAKKEVSQYSYFNDIAKAVIPSDKDQAQAVLDIQNLANQAGITIQGITFPTSTLGSKPATNDKSKATISQAQPVTGMPGLYSLQLNITPLPLGISYTKFLDFLSRVERNRRTAQITQVNIQPQAADQLSFTLQINVFIKP